MIDDVLTVTSVENTAEMNTLVKTFVESKKLRLSHEKCSRIHIGNGHTDCPKLKVHENTKKETKSEKYLGEINNETGNIESTITKRKERGTGIVAEILSIINEIPLGKHKLDVALRLREAMFLNGILHNNEAWHGLTDAHIASLESLDLALFKGILNSHAKTTKED